MKDFERYQTQVGISEHDADIVTGSETLNELFSHALIGCRNIDSHEVVYERSAGTIRRGNDQSASDGKGLTEELNSSKRR